MKITVTQQDIERGQRCDPDNCPVARALLRAGIPHRGVVGPTVMISLAEGTRAIPLPAEVKNWVLDFDARRPVAPFSFEFAQPVVPPPEPAPTKTMESDMLVGV